MSSQITVYLSPVTSGGQVRPIRPGLLTFPDSAPVPADVDCGLHQAGGGEKKHSLSIYRPQTLEFHFYLIFFTLHPIFPLPISSSGYFFLLHSCSSPINWFITNCRLWLLVFSSNCLHLYQPHTSPLRRGANLPDLPDSAGSSADLNVAPVQHCTHFLGVCACGEEVMCERNIGR